MLKTPEQPAHPRWAAFLLLALALTFGLGGAIATAEEPLATTPASTTPEPTTPTTPTTPTPPSLLGPATAASLTWTSPPQIVEDTRFTVQVTGSANGQLTGHLALLDPATPCGASPLYPRQIASGTRLAVTAAPNPMDGGVVNQALTFTESNSGTYRMCGWAVASPASSEASTVSRIDQLVGVANKTATLTVDAPPTARSADYFTVKLAGHTAGSGRRALIMAAPDTGQSCANMRKYAAGKLPLQTVVGVASGDFTKTLRLRFRSKTAGAYLFCSQIVESADRNPEAFIGQPMVVTESLKCMNTQAALTQRHADLAEIRKRRDSALNRLKASRKKAAPLQKTMSRQRAISKSRISAARKRISKAKSAKGKKKARRHLAAVQRSETRRLNRVGAPLRKINVTIRAQNRSYKQYRSGANLLNDTITRSAKDLKKYCAKPKL